MNERAHSPAQRMLLEVLRGEQALADLGKRLLDVTAEEGRAIEVIGEIVVRHALADGLIVVLRDGDRPQHIMTIVHRDGRLSEVCARLARTPLNTDPHLLSAVLRDGVAIVRPADRNIAADLIAMAREPEERALLERLAPRSVVAVPISARGEVFGALCLLSSAPQRYRDRDIFIAAEIATRAALAFDNERLFRIARAAAIAHERTLGVVAHDLRNPLASVRIHGQLMRRAHATLDPSLSDSLDGIDRCVQRMERLVSDLLDATQIEAGKLALELDVLHVRPLLLECLDAERALARDALITIAASIDDDLPPVLGDAVRLVQVLENLVGNAVKFTGAGGRVTVGASRRDDNSVLCYVRDTGVGVAPDQIGKLFESFWQADRGDRRGAGLGLAIVKGIIDAHEGAVWVESAPGAGSTFYFTLPIAGARSTASHAAPHAP